ncbi:MAG: hypothetical protein A3F41_06360 [Coxiella sp. RIFCSPHIGHO2_12_FULL_44_14]|nr:MAG: hypothetical protein A3F41_06360 [Coxiella sp. RIFCSPHIGHO2_12_FULL_44_14]
MKCQAMKSRARKLFSGFTLMELLIAIAIVAILAAVAVPTYIHYTRKAYYAEVIMAGDRLKPAVSACLDERGGTLADCDGGAYGIPADIAAGGGVGQVDSVIVADGVITVTPADANGVAAADTYVLTPTYSATAGISWAVSGGGCTAGFVSC